jgi:membrane protein YqaA with SNARE-associated domain
VSRTGFAEPRSVRAFFYSLLGYFLTPGGLILMAALDSSPIFYLPLGIDFAVIILAARKPDLSWLYAVLAALGSVVGTTVTFWIGSKIGEHGLSRFIKLGRLRRVRNRINRHTAAAVAAFAIVPPPFPFTALVLSSGALGANRWTFLTTFAGVRAARFLVEAGLAARYGRRILIWMQSTVFEIVVGVLIVLAVGGTIVSAIAVYRNMRTTRAT